MSKTTYTATFSDGTTITRTSEREYGVAWLATWKNENGTTGREFGFSNNQHSANPYAPCKWTVTRGMSSAERSRRMKLNAEYRKQIGYRVEFAIPTTTN